MEIEERDSKCPMFKNKKYKLTEKQIKYFCGSGCSVSCEELFEEYIKRSKIREEVE